MELKAALAIDAHDTLGEVPIWDGTGRRLLWIDHGTHLIHEARHDAVAGWRETNRWPLDWHVAVVIPRSKGGLIALGATEVFTVSDTGARTQIARLDVDAKRTRINDAKCDPQGRLWAGTLTTDFEQGGAALYRIDPDGAVSAVLTGVTLANGLDWSPDGHTFYFVDSLTRRIDAFDFDGKNGTISGRRVVATLERGAPNGLAVDREGCIWVASTGGSDVQRYAPSGEYLGRVEIGTPGATSCAFGGEDGGDLLITSRSGRMPEVARTLGLTTEMMANFGPQAGGLFVCRPGVTGAPANPFAG